MINNAIVITKNYSLLNRQMDQLKEKFSISFEMEDERFFDQLQLLIIHQSSLLNQSNINFCIHIKPSGIANLKEKDLLLQYFFHPNYLLIENKPALSLNNADRNNATLNKLLSGLEIYLVKQGYMGIERIYFEELLTAVKDANYCLKGERSEDEISVSYLELMREKFYTAKYIGIHSDNIGSFLEALKNAENQLMESDPQQFLLLKKTSDSVRENINLKKELLIAQQDLANHKTYLKFYQDKDETVKIQEFYLYEYEILPTWYKKVGHLLKVAMGKRSFLSLFRNDVKKYTKTDNIKKEK